MSMDLKAIMEHSKRRCDMLASPELTGDLLLLALALDEVVRRKRGKLRTRAGRNWVEEAAVIARGESDLALSTWWVKDLISRDLPCYKTAETRSRACVVPTPRKPACGRSGSIGMTDRDPLTGEGALVWFCSRHREHEAAVDERIKQWVANGKPEPPANSGGVLRRWFGGNWDSIYRWASGRDPMPGGREATPPRPTLRLIEGGAQ